MGSILRSVPLERIQLIIQKDAAVETFDELGKLQLLQFIDVFYFTLIILFYFIYYVIFD